ncbi:transketolase [Ruminococcaceae bacterium OttesenSCG-928-L11]|nr:transketolase [Ruminococcaceae bacterium OttesenSCG-928-L11]
MEMSLSGICRAVREDILQMIYRAGSGHPGASLSAVELLVALYMTGMLRCDPSRPDDPARDRFILSKGHAVPALYSVLCRMGFFAREQLDTLRTLDGLLQGHPRLGITPGIDCSAGSLGQGLSIANGMALAFKRQQLPGRVYCLIGDGEQQEGQIWEAALSAVQLRLSNVCVIVDNNHIQLDGATASVKKMEPIADKWRSFGWNVIGADGHDLADMEAAYRQAAACGDTPSVIIAETVKGKGISFMENSCDWHSNPPTREELNAALAELSRQPAATDRVSANR